MRTSIVFAALALVSSVFATESLFTCPPIHKAKKKTCPISSAPKGHGKGNGHKKAPTITPAKATTIKAPGHLIEIKTGTYAILHVETGLFLAIDLINGQGVASLSSELALVSVNQIKIGDDGHGDDILAITISAGLDFELGLVLNAVINGDIDAAAKAGLKLVVGGVSPNTPSCSPYYQPVKCGVVPSQLIKAASKMAKVPVVSSVLDLTAKATAAIGLDALIDIVVGGLAEVIVSVCLVASAELDVNAQALTIDPSAKAIALDALVEAEANAWVFVKIAADANIL